MSIWKKLTSNQIFIPIAAFVILIIVVALNLIGDALQKQFDPKLK